MGIFTACNLLQYYNKTYNNSKYVEGNRYNLMCNVNGKLKYKK